MQVLHTRDYLHVASLHATPCALMPHHTRAGLDAYSSCIIFHRHSHHLRFRARKRTLAQHGSNLPGLAVLAPASTSFDAASTHFRAYTLPIPPHHPSTLLAHTCAQHAQVNDSYLPHTAPRYGTPRFTRPRTAYARACAHLSLLPRAPALPFIPPE